MAIFRTTRRQMPEAVEIPLMHTDTKGIMPLIEAMRREVEKKEPGLDHIFAPLSNGGSVMRAFVAVGAEGVIKHRYALHTDEQRARVAEGIVTGIFERIPDDVRGNFAVVMDQRQSSIIGVTVDINARYSDYGRSETTPTTVFNQVVDALESRPALLKELMPPAVLLGIIPRRIRRAMRRVIAEGHFNDIVLDMQRMGII